MASWKDKLMRLNRDFNQANESLMLKESELQQLKNQASQNQQPQREGSRQGTRTGVNHITSL